MLTHLKRLSVRLNRQSEDELEKGASRVLDYLINELKMSPSKAVKTALVSYGVQLEFLNEDSEPCLPMVAEEDRIAWKIVEILENSGVLLQQQQTEVAPPQAQLKPKSFDMFS